MALTVTRTDWIARNARGVPVRIFGDEDHGRQWVKANAHLHDGLALHCAEHMVSERRVYRPRVAAPVDFAIPASIGASA